MRLRGLIEAGRAREDKAFWHTGKETIGEHLTSKNHWKAIAAKPQPGGYLQPRRRLILGTMMEMMSNTWSHREIDTGLIPAPAQTTDYSGKYSDCIWRANHQGIETKVVMAKLHSEIVLNSLINRLGSWGDAVIIGNRERGNVIAQFSLYLQNRLFAAG